MPTQKSATARFARKKLVIERSRRDKVTTRITRRLPAKNSFRENIEWRNIMKRNEFFIAILNFRSFIEWKTEKMWYFHFATWRLMIIGYFWRGVTSNKFLANYVDELRLRSILWVYLFFFQPLMMKPWGTRLNCKTQVKKSVNIINKCVPGNVSSAINKRILRDEILFTASCIDHKFVSSTVKGT